MKHHIFEENAQYPVALLFKENAFNKNQIEKFYIQPLEALPDSLLGQGLQHHSPLHLFLFYLLPAIHSLQEPQLPHPIPLQVFWHR